MITVTVFKTGLALEADLSRLTRKIQKNEHCNYNVACQEAEKRLDKIAWKQIIHTEVEKLDLISLGEHIAQGAPFKIEKSS